MERERSGNGELRRLLEAIKSSDVVENRVQLVTKLGDLELNDSSDLSSLVESLASIWEDFTCLDLSQCILNKAILEVAAKYVDSDLSGCLVPFLDLEIKACVWCGKHLKMTLMSTGESQEDEHSDHFFQLLVDLLGMSSASMMALARSSVWNDNKTTAAVEKLVIEQLNLVIDVTCDIKRINSLGSEILKVAQVVVASVIRLWKEFSSAVSWDECDARLNNDPKEIQSEESDTVDHFTSVTKHTVQKLCDLGVVAAKNGGQLVNILNTSWKGIVTLLQHIKGKLKEIVHVQDIILSLIAVVKGHLSCAAEVWSSTLKDAVSATEAKRTFLPVKFYLLQMVKICSLYDHETNQIRREIAFFLVEISLFKISLNSEKLLVSASEVFSDLLEDSSSDLLLCLLNSDEVKHELKSECLDWLFVENCGTNSISLLSLTNSNRMSLMVTILSGKREDAPSAVLLLGQVVVIHTLLRCSVGLGDEVKTRIARKLGWLLDKIVDEEIYSSILDMKILVSHNSGKRTEWVWHPMFSALLDSLKTFMIVTFSSSAWSEVEGFLLENLLHPHFLCWDIVTELWHFLVEHAEANMAKGIFDKLCSIMKLVTSPGLVHSAGSPLRKMARTVCWLLHGNDTSMADHIFVSLFGVKICQFSPEIFLALVLEGFALNSLSESIRCYVQQNVIASCDDFITSSKNHLAISSSDALGFPALAISAALQTQQEGNCGVEKATTLLVTILQFLGNNMDKQILDHSDLLSQALWNFSYMKQPYESDQMEVVLLTLKKLFLPGESATSFSLHQCKPYLAIFMGGLGTMEMSESDDCAKSCAVWELYHMVLRERHWALAHLAIASFGQFAAHTSCNQLWRFVPEGAALAYDLQSGTEPKQGTFMQELKGFLEKETALQSAESSFEQYEMLRKEGLILRQSLQKISDVPMDTISLDNKETADEGEARAAKKRKLPEGINKGVELLECGLKAIGDGISQWQQDSLDSSKHHNQFLTQFSCLEDMVAQLKGLVDYT